MKRLLLTLLPMLVPAGAPGAEWRSTDESTFTFASTFEGEPIEGKFEHFDARFDFDPENPTAAHLVVTVELAAADMGDEDMNAVLFDEAWFDVARFETAVYESSAVEQRTADEFVANGELDLKGARACVRVPFSWHRSDAGARMRGELTLQRADFGVGTGEWASGETIGLDVHLAFDVLLEQVD